MNLKALFDNILWLLREARTFSPVKFYRLLRDIDHRPRPFPIQFKTRRNQPAKRPVKLSEGSISVPFSALDENGIIRGDSDIIESRNTHTAQEQKPYVNEKISLNGNGKEKIPAPVMAKPAPSKQHPSATPSAEGVKLQEQLLREAIESVEKPNPEFPFLDCIDLHHRLTITGIRHGHVHLLARNALGKTFKAELHDMFDSKGRLKVKGLSVRLPVFTSSGEAPPVYKKVGVIDLTGYVGLTVHTLAQMEDALNDGITKLRRSTTESKSDNNSPHKKSPPTLALLQNIRSLLSKQKTQQERRSYVDRRAGDDRRTTDSRRVENERRSGVDRRQAKETVLKNAMLVKEEEYRKDERRKSERRSLAERRQLDDRRRKNERRHELHITSERSQYIHADANTILAYVSDKWNSSEKLEGEEIILNPRGDVASMHILMNRPEGKISLQGEKDTPCETFVTPVMGIPVLIRSNTDATLHCVTGSKGFLRFKPRKKTKAAITILASQSMLSGTVIELSAKGLRKIVMGTLTIEVSAFHKDCILMTPEGKQYPLNDASDVQKIAAAFSSAPAEPQQQTAAN